MTNNYLFDVGGNQGGTKSEFSVMFGILVKSILLFFGASHIPVHQITFFSHGLNQVTNVYIDYNSGHKHFT